MTPKSIANQKLSEVSAPDNGLIKKAAQARHAVETRVQTNERFSVVPAESSYPVIILAETPSGHFPVHVSRCLRNSVMEPVDGPAPDLEIIPGPFRGWKRNGNLGDTDNRSSDYPSPVSDKKPPCRPGTSSPFLPQQMDQKCGIGYHLRPPDRRPRVFAMCFSISRSTSGGGCCSIASKMSPQVSAGAITCLRITLVNESRVLLLSLERSL